jgi:hypothetical protein
MSKKERQTEIDQNLEFFMEKLPNLLNDHKNRYVLLNNKNIVGIYDTIRDAQTTGDKLFQDQLYSIQKVSEVAMDLGFFSHADYLG